MENQNDIWSKHTEKLNLAQILESYKKPSCFQIELKNLIDSYYKDDSKIIEVGCEMGVTSFILDNHFKKTLLDINPVAICLAKDAFNHFNQTADFLIDDMFHMKFADRSFDIVFNAGVLEHFNCEDRVSAIKEYSRICRDDGVMFIAYPNHKSIPYDLASRFMKLLHKWPFPKDYPMHNFESELTLINDIHIVERRTLSKKSIFDWWNFFKPIKVIFKLTDKIFNYEGYLTVLIIKKTI